MYANQKPILGPELIAIVMFATSVTIYEMVAVERCTTSILIFRIGHDYM